MISRSPYPDVVIPRVSLAELIVDRAREQGERTALVDGVSGRQVTYAQLVDSVERTAAGLAGTGFRKGEVAVICVPNSPGFAVAFLAVARLGGVVTMMNPAFTAGEMVKQMDDAQPAIAFTTEALAETVIERERDSRAVE